MLRGMREYLAARNGRMVAGALLLIAAAALAWSLRSALRGDEAFAFASRRLYICAQTGRDFQHAVKAGEFLPVYSPHSKQNTGYPAERCYWTADGAIKKSPTPVLLNSWIKEPGPTFCLECGRLVVPHNPAPVQGRPPPTRQEYAQRAGR